MNAWDMLSPADVVRRGVTNKVCSERLNGVRCVLKRGHDGNHAVPDPTKETK